MNLLNIAVILILLLGCIFEATAETIGIRFVVSDELGRNTEQQQTTKSTLEKYVVELNRFYRNSQVELVAEIVQVEFSRIESVGDLQILDDMAHERNGFELMFRRANEFGADYTVAMVSKLLMYGKPGCGRAYAVNQSVEAISSTRKAFAVVNFVCGAHTLAHELGHLMGLNHGSLVAQCRHDKTNMSAIAPYANGYAEGNCDGKPQPGEFGDIMVGGGMRDINGDDHSSLHIFSNPRIRDVRCGVNQICGNKETGDAARALNENAHYYASHEEPDVHTLHYESEALLECIIKKYKGKEILDMHELVCTNFNIRKIAGIERLIALRIIDLSGDIIDDVSPLEKLPPDVVERINLTGNTTVSCSSLGKLTDIYGDKLVRPTSCRH
jgi:hypothetical protein